MLDWILNPEGVSLNAYMILWGALLIMLPIAIVIGVIKAWRDK